MTADLITQRMREIVDRTDVLDTVTAYAAAVDGGDWTVLASLFDADATFDCPGLGSAHGPEGVTEFVAAVVAPLDACQHVNSNHRVTVRGDEAAHTCYLLAQHVRHGLADGELYLIAGRYDDRLRRTPHGWRFTSRVLTVLWRQGNPAVVAPAPVRATP